MSVIGIVFITYFAIGLVLGYTYLLRGYDRSPEGVAPAVAIAIVWLPIGILYILQEINSSSPNSVNEEEEK